MRKQIYTFFSRWKAPLLSSKFYKRSAVFKPANLLREARRQQKKIDGVVPKWVILDPDGDILKYLITSGKASRSNSWACYHTSLYEFILEGRKIGVIGNAVGGPFAVLLAEQLFVSGCELLVSITSSGKISTDLDAPCYILVDKALRDEGTSYHYLAPDEYVPIHPYLLSALTSVQWDSKIRLTVGPVWTTDAPYRETDEAIARARDRGLLAVEMETASLYAFGMASGCPVISFAHVTNQMAQTDVDFEKGEAAGATNALLLLNQCLDAVSTA